MIQYSELSLWDVFRRLNQLGIPPAMGFHRWFTTGNGSIVAVGHKLYPTILIEMAAKICAIPHVLIFFVVAFNFQLEDYSWWSQSLAVFFKE